MSRGWGFTIPQFYTLWHDWTPFSSRIGFPPFALYLQAIPLVAATCAVLFGDLIQAEALVADLQRPGHRRYRCCGTDLSGAGFAIGVGIVLCLLIYGRDFVRNWSTYDKTKDPVFNAHFKSAPEPASPAPAALPESKSIAS